MSVTLTTAASTIKPVYGPYLHDLVFRNNQLLDLFARFGVNMEPTEGDSAYRFLINSAGNSSVETFSEGDPQAAPGNQTVVAGAVTYLAFRGQIQFSGHAEAALKSNYVNHIDLEFEKLALDIKDLINTTFMAATAGLELSVDYGSAYAGITRNGAAGYFESVETAVSGQLSWDSMITMLESIKDNDHGGRPSLILCPFNQTTNIYALSGQPGIKQFTPTNAAQGYSAQMFDNCVVEGIADMTDTVILFLDMRRGKFVLKEHRPMEIYEMARSGDSRVFSMVWAGNLINTEPKYDGKLTGVTA